MAANVHDFSSGCLCPNGVIFVGCWDAVSDRVEFTFPGPVTVGACWEEDGDTGLLTGGMMTVNHTTQGVTLVQWKDDATGLITCIVDPIPDPPSPDSPVDLEPIYAPPPGPPTSDQPGDPPGPDTGPTTPVVDLPPPTDTGPVDDEEPAPDPVDDVEPAPDPTPTTTTTTTWPACLSCCDYPTSVKMQITLDINEPHPDQNFLGNKFGLVSLGQSEGNKCKYEIYGVPDILQDRLEFGPKLWNFLVYFCETAGGDRKTRAVASNKESQNLGFCEIEHNFIPDECRGGYAEPEGALGPFGLSGIVGSECLPGKATLTLEVL